VTRSHSILRKIVLDAVAATESNRNVGISLGVSARRSGPG
jgi:hypothetical protein